MIKKRLIELTNLRLGKLKVVQHSMHWIGGYAPRFQAFSSLRFILISPVPPEKHRDDVWQGAGKPSPAHLRVSPKQDDVTSRWAVR